MKTKLFLIICLLGQKAFSQATMVETASRVTNVSVLPPNSFSLVTSYNHMDLNKNNYKGDHNVTDMDPFIPYGEKYSYREFIDGHVIYSSGNQSQLLKLNYHQLYGEMQFIDENGDTLFIPNTDTISYVRLDNYLYQRTSDMGYLKILSGNHQVKLGLQEQLKCMELNRNSNLHFNTPYEQVVLSKHKSYFLISDLKENWLANKSGFLKAFPNHKQQIRTYLHQMAQQRMAIQFYKEEDLIVLMNFCISLQQVRI